MSRRSLIYLQSYLPHSLGLLLILVLLIAAQGFIAEHPALASLLVLAFSLPYLAASIAASQAYYLYGAMLLGAASYFMACQALGAPVAWFPVLSLPLVGALWFVGRHLRADLSPGWPAFAATTFRAMNVTVATFTFLAIWQLPSLLTPGAALGGIAAVTLLGYAALYLAHGLVFRSGLYAFVFSCFATVALGLAGLTVLRPGLLPFFFETAAFVILVAATFAHARGGVSLSRNYFLCFAATLALAFLGIWLEPGYGLHVVAAAVALTVIGYLLLSKTVPGVALATSNERLLARLLLASGTGLAALLAPFLLIPSLAHHWPVPALIAGTAFAVLAWRRRTDGTRRRNLHVYGAAMFLSAAAGGFAAYGAASAPVAVVLGTLAMMLVLRWRASAARLDGTERALTESLVFPAFWGWYFPLMTGDTGIAMTASLATLGILVLGAAARRRSGLLCGCGPALAGVWLVMAPTVAASTGLPLWAVVSAGAALAGIVFAAGFKRYPEPVRLLLGLLWMIAATLGVVTAYAAAGFGPAVHAAAVIAAAALVVTGLLRRSHPAGAAFNAAAWVVAAVGAGLVATAGAMGTIDPATVSAALFSLAAAGALGYLAGRSLWLGRVVFAAFASAGLCLAFYGAGGTIPFALYSAGVPLTLFLVAAALRNGEAALARNALFVAHTATIAAGLLLGMTSHSAPITPDLALAVVPYAILYAAGTILWGTAGFRFGALAWAGMAIVFALAAYTGGRYAEHATAISLVAAVWLGLGFALDRRGKSAWPASLFLASAFLAGAAALLVSVEAHSAEGWRVFVMSGLIFGLLAVLSRQDIWVYVMMLCMALMMYDWVRASTSHFTQDVFFYPVAAAMVLSFVLLLPHFKKLANRFAALPVFGIFSLKGAAFLMVPVLGGSAFLTSAYSLKVTAHPRFCTSCHYMDQYYDSWQHSSHQTVACIECHYEPGIKNEIAGKGEGLIQLIKYVSHSYTNRPHGIVTNQSCLRSGCHEDIVNSGETLLFNDKIRFRHDRHLKEHPRGQDLNCVSCHGQMVQGTHIGVTPTTCLTCHFYKRGEKPVAVGDCLSCHSVLDETVKIGNETFNHPAFLADKSGVECSHCHSQVTQGAGEVSESRCRSCHLENYGPVENPEAFHLIHVAKKHFDCLQCHDEIRHGTRPMDQQVHTSSTDCNSCHGGERHTIQQRIYEGTAVPELEEAPDFMYVAGVTCDGCHTDLHMLRIGEMTLTGKQSTAKQCTDCHADESYGQMLVEWQAEIKGRVSELQVAAETLRGKCDAVPEDQAAPARALVDKANVKIEHIVLDGSYGAHNYFYITAILDSAAEDLDACAKVAGEWTTATNEEPAP